MLNSDADTIANDKLIRLETALPKLGPALEQKRLGAALKQATATLTTFDGQLKQFESLARAAELLKPYIEHNRPVITDVLEEVEDLAATMEGADDQPQLSTVARFYPEFSQKHIPRLHRALSAMAQTYVTKNIAALSTLGKLLTRIGATEVGQKLQQLEVSASRLPMSSALALPETIEQVEAQRATTQGELKALAKDPEVDAFLLALSRGQSSLSLVTPKVLDWLDDLNARDQFRVLSV